MERERPEYLESIPRTRWEFPWLGLWAVLLLGMAGAGIWLHVRTGDAWNTRFNAPPASSVTTTSAIPAEPPKTEIDPNREAMIAHIRMRREWAEREAKREATRQREELRCIGGVAFRRIPGGWENVPGATCP